MSVSTFHSQFTGSTPKSRKFLKSFSQSENSMSFLQNPQRIIFTETLQCSKDSSGLTCCFLKLSTRDFLKSSPWTSFSLFSSREVTAHELKRAHAKYERFTVIQTVSRRFHRCKVFHPNAGVNESEDYLPAKDKVVNIVEGPKVAILVKVYNCNGILIFQ